MVVNGVQDGRSAEPGSWMFPGSSIRIHPNECSVTLPACGRGKRRIPTSAGRSQRRLSSARTCSASTWPPSARWPPMSSRTSARTALRSGVSCSLSGDYAPKRLGGGGAATSIVDALQQVAMRATYAGKLDARSVTDIRRRPASAAANCERQRPRRPRRGPPAAAGRHGGVQAGKIGYSPGVAGQAMMLTGVCSLGSRNLSGPVQRGWPNWSRSWRVSASAAR
jgi:hypothetical protein